MKISVIVPIYNSEKYLHKCLDSLINQTMKDIEIICINDGSTDNSAKILEEYNSIKIINQENQGVSAARNSGIKIACGEYIGFVDSDDWVNPNFYEKLYNAIKNTNADIACSSIIRVEGLIKKHHIRYDENKFYTSLDDRVKIVGLPKCSYVWNKLYRAEIVKNMLFKNGVFYEDLIWTPQILEKTNSLVTACNAEYYYRANSSSIVKKQPSLKKQEDFYLAKKEMIDFFEKHFIKLDEKEKNITKRKKYLFNILLLKIKEYKYTKTYYLFGFIPTIKISQYPNLGENND